MNSTNRIVNRQDRTRLLSAIETARRSWRTYGPHLDWFANQLDAAHACEPAEIPADVVTMNSRVEVQDLRTDTTRTFRLVYPDDHGGDDHTADRDKGEDTISVFDPRGLALFGRRVGDVLGWNVPDRASAVRVGRLRYQPESAGDAHR